MKKIIIWLVRGYKRFISPLLPPACRFYPTCSAYAVTAVERFGFLRGIVLAGWRILRCNPFCRGGIDYVPPKIEGEPFRAVLRKVRLHQTKVEA